MGIEPKRVKELLTEFIENNLLYYKHGELEEVLEPSDQQLKDLKEIVDQAVNEIKGE